MSSQVLPLGQHWGAVLSHLRWVPAPEEAELGEGKGEDGAGHPGLGYER